MYTNCNRSLVSKCIFSNRKCVLRSKYRIWTFSESSKIWTNNVNEKKEEEKTTTSTKEHTKNRLHPKINNMSSAVVCCVKDVLKTYFFSLVMLLLFIERSLCLLLFVGKINLINCSYLDWINLICLRSSIGYGFRKQCNKGCN